MCDHTLCNVPDGLACENPAPHDPGHGCIYVSRTGSHVNDTHLEGGHG